MTEWEIKDSELKKYPHFDSVISAVDAKAYATNSAKVERHQFYPFMRYTQGWNRFSEKGQKGERKDRPIRFAARRDAYIFMYYRFLLSRLYENEIKSSGIDRCVIAYRRIPTDDGSGGKCNIHFAADAISKIRELGDCSVAVLDISQYFESLDHARLLAHWRHLLGATKLPDDHYKVYRAVTAYAVVEKQEVYERLGHFGVKRKSASGKDIKGYLTPHRKIPRQLCSGKEFREKIEGDGKVKSIIEKNRKPFGIPQGSPISDLLANILT